MDITQENYVELTKNATNDIRQLNEETYEQFIEYIEELKNVEVILQKLLDSIDKIDAGSIPDIEKTDWFDNIPEDMVDQYYDVWNDYADSLTDITELSADINEAIDAIEHVTEKY